MSKNAKKSALPFYALGLTWVIYALIFPLYKLSHFIVLFVLSIIVVVLAKGFAKTAFENSLVEEPQAPRDEKTSAAIEEANTYLSQIKLLNDRIEGVEVSKQIFKIEALVEKIFSTVSKDPSQLSSVRRMLNYYLPTTVKLLKNYNSLEDQKVSTANIRSTIANIESALDTIVAAFEKQLDSLYDKTAMEISADIDVLETIMSQEGLLQDELKLSEK